MGGAQGAAARDHTAIYYNPANLVLRTKTHFGLALSYVRPALYIESTLEEAGEALLPEQNVGVALGFAFPLGGRLDYRVVVGFTIFLPLIKLTRLEAIDPARPHFYLYESLPDHLVIAPAVGFRITDWLRVGVGVQILAAFRAGVDVTGDVINRRMEQRTLTVSLGGATGPIAGISTTFGPFELGVTFRDELELRYGLPINFRFEGVGTVLLDVGGTALYSPRQLNVGISWRIEDPDLLIASDLTVAFWSTAPDPTLQVDAVVTDEELRPDEDTIGTLFDIHTTPLDLGAQNVVIPRVGLEWRANSVFHVRGGFFHRPAMLPDQNGYTNILDCTANVFSLGAGATFFNPLHVTDEPLTIDLHLQLSQLNQRQTVKDPSAGAPESGSLESGGVIFGAGVEFRQDF